MPSEIGSAWIQAGGTLIAAVVAVVGIGWQIKAQAELSRLAIVEGESRKIKASMYDEGLRLARRVCDSSIGLSSQLRVASVNLRAELAAGGPNSAIPTPPLTFMDLAGLHTSVSNDCLTLVALIEERRIIDPKIVIFRDFLLAQMYDLSNVFTLEFPGHLMLVVPTPVGDVVHREAFTVERWEETIESVDRSLKALSDIVMVMEDFNVEMQNLLLSDIFGHQVEHRVPIDPKCLVVSIRNIPAVEAALAQTAWGKMCNYAEEQERERQRRLAMPNQTI